MDTQVEKSKTENVQSWLHAFERTALIVKHPTPGVLFASGEDALNLIDRMSTNDLGKVSVGTIKSTVLTDVHAKIIDRIHVLQSKEGLLVLTSPDRQQLVLDWLARHIFFQDDAKLTISEKSWSHWGVYGPHAYTEVRRVLGEAIHLKPSELQTTEGGVLWGTEEPGMGYLMLLDEEKSNLAAEHWHADTASEQAFEILRIEAGIPQSPAEISDEFIPLEVGLWDSVSFTKGCYIGQEIIARMESRGKLAKHLYRVELDQSVPVGAIVRQNNARIGTLTSIVYSPASGWIGLAVAKPGSAKANDGQVDVGDEQVRGNLQSLTSLRHGPLVES